jgi:uncharacterized protein
MEFEWDEAKRISNLRKHGIDFADVPAMFDGDTLTFEDVRNDYGEQRFTVYGLLQYTIAVVIYTDRKQNIRIISARRASNYEQRIYCEEFSD